MTNRTEENDGQTLVEYVLIMTLCSILLIAMLATFAGTLGKYIGKVTGVL